MRETGFFKGSLTESTPLDGVTLCKAKQRGFRMRSCEDKLTGEGMIMKY